MAQKITGLSGPLGAKCGKEPELLKTLDDIRHTRPETYLYSYILHSYGHKAVGFKLKYEELGSPEYTRHLDFIKADTDLKMSYSWTGKTCLNATFRTMWS